MQRTKIEYLDYTWNPLAMRCEGCRNCWHLSMVKRLSRNPKICNEFKNAYAGVIPPVLIHTELEAPLHLRKPARIGVQFMGDLFHDSIPGQWIIKVFQIMEQAHWHTFFLLTKRLQVTLPSMTDLENVWLGVSCEDQKTADERIPILLKTPAAHRWVSVEPMLESVELRLWQYNLQRLAAAVAGRPETHIENPIPKLGWVVSGGETGPNARPLHPEWVRSIRDQCQAAGVPFFFKSWGEWLEKKLAIELLGDDDPRLSDSQRRRGGKAEMRVIKNDIFIRVGHGDSGHLIDGQEWRQMP